MRKLKIGLIACLVCLALACGVALAACGPDAKTTYQLTWQPDEHVKVVAEGYTELPTELEEGTEVVFTATPDAGYEISSVTPVTITKDGEKYKFTVERDITIKVITKRIITSIDVDTPDTLVYYAGETINPKDYKVTVNYQVGASETTDAYTVSYQNGEAFALGDTKFEIKYGGKSKEITLDEAVVGKVTLKLEGGVLPADNALTGLTGYTYDATASTVSWTFDKALEKDIALPQPTKTVNGALFPFIRWSGVENNKIAKGTVVSVNVTALYDVQLVEINKLELTTKEITETVKVTEDGVEKDKEVTVTVPYLVITGKFVGATEAYLYLFEGNAPVTSLDGPTVTKGATDSFTLEFDLRDFVNAIVDKIGNDGKPTGETTNLKGKWMDIKFCAKVGERTETQEINLNNYAKDFIDTNDTLEAKVGETWWQFAYKVHTPNPGDTIHQTDGAEYVGDENLLKLVYQDCPPVSISNVEITVDTPEEGDPTAYLKVTGQVIQADKKEDAEALLKAFAGENGSTKTSGNDQLGFQRCGQNGGGWEYPGYTVEYKVNSDCSFELTLSMEKLTDSSEYYIHFNGNNWSAKVDTATVTAGKMQYTIFNRTDNYPGTNWTNGLMWITVEDTSIPKISAESISFEVDETAEKVYYVTSISFKNYADADAVKAAITRFDFDDNNADVIYTGDTLASMITVDMEAKTATIKADITNLAMPGDGYVWTHLYLNETKSDLAIYYNNVQSVTYNGLKYENKRYDFEWGTRYLLTISDSTYSNYAYEDITLTGYGLEEKDGEAVLVITGTVDNYVANTEDTIKLIHFATVNNGNFAGNPVSSWATTNHTKDIVECTTYVEGEDGTATFTITWNLSNMGERTCVWLHLGGDSKDLPTNKMTEGKETVTVGDKTYTLVPQDADKSPQLEVTTAA